MGSFLLAFSLLFARGPTCFAAVTTAYSREYFPGPTATGKSTASGRWAATHTWAEIPFGTVLTVGSFGDFILEDTGDAEGIVPDPWFDLLVQTQREAIDYGRRIRLVCAKGDD